MILAKLFSLHTRGRCDHMRIVSGNSLLYYRVSNEILIEFSGFLQSDIKEGDDACSFFVLTHSGVRGVASFS